MRAIYYELPEKTVVTCSDECLAAYVAGHGSDVPYRHTDGTLMTESDDTTRRYVLSGEIPAAWICDQCYEELPVTTPSELN